MRATSPPFTPTLERAPVGPSHLCRHETQSRYELPGNTAARITAAHPTLTLRLFSFQAVHGTCNHFGRRGEDVLSNLATRPYLATNQKTNARVIRQTWLPGPHDEKSSVLPTTRASQSGGAIFLGSLWRRAAVESLPMRVQKAAKRWETRYENKTFGRVTRPIAYPQY